jgi:AcrR family transcriptional regulator
MNLEKRQKVLRASLQAFFKYGYSRITMKELADVSGISRTALYMEFKDKAEVLNAAILTYAEDLLKEIAEALKKKRSTEEKLLCAFEIWSIRSFDSLQASDEARELMEGGMSFAKSSYSKAYELLEETIARILKSHFKDPRSRKVLSAERTARHLVGAARGFKLMAKDSEELRKLIQENIKLSL